LPLNALAVEEGELLPFAIDCNEDRDVRIEAAIGLAEVTNGDVDDGAVAEAIAASQREDSDSRRALAKIANHGKRKEIRTEAALALVRVTDGEIDDMGVVEAIAKSVGTDVEYFPASFLRHGALLMIAKRSTSKAVRAAAQQYLPKSDLESLRKEGLLVAPGEVFDELKRH
jgi:hypothetical protein